MSLITLPSLQIHNTIPITHFYASRNAIFSYSTRYYIGTAESQNERDEVPNHDPQFFPVQSQVGNASLSLSQQRTAQKMHPFRTFEHVISCIALNHIQPTQIFIAFTNGALCVYNWQTDELLQTHDKRHKSAISGVLMTHSGSHLITCGDDGHVIVSPTRDLSFVQFETRHSMPVQSIQLMAQQRDGEIVVASGASLLFWNWMDEEDQQQNPAHMRVLAESSRTRPLRRLVAHGGNTMSDITINSFDTHPYRASIYVAGSSNGTLSVWDLEIQEAPIKTLQYSSSPIWKVRFARDEDVMEESSWCACYTSHDDGSVLRWEIPRDLTQAWALRGTRSPMTLEYKHELSAIVDFALCDANGGVANEDELVVVTEFGDIVSRELRRCDE